MFRNLLSIILKGIRYRSLRSWLTIVGIVIAVMLVVVIFSLGSGVENAVSKALQQFGSDLLIVFPGKESNPFIGIVGGQKFAESDVQNLELLPGVRYAVPFAIGSLNGEYKGEKQTVLIHSAPWKTMRPLFEESRGIILAEGTWPVSEESNEVVAGYLAATTLFKNKLQVGDDIIIHSKRFRISGIFSKMGSQEDDNSIYMSWNIFHEVTGLKRGAQSIIIKADPAADLALLSEQVKFQLSKQDAVRDFTVITPDQAKRLVGNVLNIVELVLIVIALISLLVGSVGIMNTMYTSVLERTKQIGIMKAIGATNDLVLSLFLIESGMIGLIGGVIGLVLGISFAFLIGFAADAAGVPNLFSWGALDYLGFFVILFITFLVGIVSGVLPARQASKMEPAEALRYE
jgi:putative ABC transport system permease protein